MLIQFHILQNYAPANLNRDDTGSPKDAYLVVFDVKNLKPVPKRSIRLSRYSKPLLKKTD